MSADERLQEWRALALRVEEEVARAVIGQAPVIRLINVALFARGHVLLEGDVGVGKTTLLRAFSRAIGGDFERVEGTVDLLPGDLTGSEVYRPQDGSFHFQRGPLFHNLVLADEINRAPAKVQSALLEAMAEGTVSVGGTGHALPRPFTVLATQNPIEHEGTFPLPEAQLDRFLMHVRIDYPAAVDERRILRLARDEARWLERSRRTENDANHSQKD